MPTPSLPDTKVTVLISGEGSNLQALIDASNAVRQNYTDYFEQGECQWTQPCKMASIPTEYHNLVKYGYHKSGEKDPAVKQAAREKYDAQLAEIVLKDSPDLVVTAGWMHILAPTFLDPLAEKGVPVINLHRSS